MKKILTLFSLGIFVPFAIMAQTWGFWDLDRSYIWFQENANVNTYSIWNGAPGTFHNHNFGTLSYGDVLTINGYDTKTWKNEGAGEMLRVVSIITPSILPVTDLPPPFSFPWAVVG